MAFVNAAYVDMGKVWGYDPNTRNAQGFYDNAWVWGDVAPHGTDFLPCSYFYVVGQKDNLGFTPTSIDFNTASGLLSVQGTQEGVERIFLRNYMVGAPAPRFLNVRVNQRSRRLADLPVVAIITDNDETLPNIRGHLGMLDEEEGEVAEAETFEASTRFNIGKCDWAEDCKCEDEDIHCAKCNFNLTTAGREECPNGCFVEFTRSDSWLGAETFEATSDYVKRGFEVFREGFPSHANYYIKKGDNRIALDYDRRTDWGMRPSAKEYPYEYGEEGSQFAEETFRTLDDALKWFDEQIENGRVFRDWGMSDDTDSSYGAETFGAEGEDNSLSYHAMAELCRDFASFISSNEIQFGLEWSPQRQIMVAQSFKNEADYVKWVINRFNKYAQEMIDNDLNGAEEFGAEDDYEKAQRIMKLLRVVMRKATGPNARYAKTYAINAENSYYDYGFRGLKAQVAYVLSNLGGWRGDEAKQVKAELRKLIK